MSKKKKKIQEHDMHVQKEVRAKIDTLNLQKKVRTKIGSLNVQKKIRTKISTSIRFTLGASYNCYKKREYFVATSANEYDQFSKQRSPMYFYLS